MCTKENSKLFEISLGILFDKKRFIVSKKGFFMGHIISNSLLRIITSQDQ